MSRFYMLVGPRSYDAYQRAGFNMNHYEINHPIWTCERSEYAALCVWLQGEWHR